MKKMGFYSILVAALLVTGCSQKEVEVDANANNANAGATTNSDNALNQVSVNEQAVEGSANMQGENGTYVMINGKRVFLKSVYFAFNQYDISPEMRDVIKQNAALLSEYTGKFKIEGNCDEWGTDEYNYALGLKRANAVKNALVADGLNADNISLVSFGESNPICSESNASCWEKNRRADYKLLP